MNHRWLKILVSGGLLAQAQTVNLRGTVSSGGQPVSGAIVTLIKQGLKDTTGSDGVYVFSKTSTAIAPSLSGTKMITLAGGALEFELTEPSPVAIDLFDINGKRLKSENIGVQGTGRYRWTIEGDYSANQILIVRASIGNQVSTFRYMPISGGQATQGTNRTRALGRSLAMTATAIDSIEVTAPGFSSKRAMVESYVGQLDISLDRIDNSGDRWGGLNNPPAKSAGCGKPAGLTTALRTIMSGGKSREYWIDLPPNYDMNKPSKVVFVYHWSGGTAASMKNNKYYNIQPLATAANIPTIFVAPTHSASEADHTEFLDILSLVESNLCVDSTRIFATGYSLGAMMSYSLSTKQQAKLRAVATIEAANFNVWLPNPKPKDPIAYMGITGMQDEVCIWDGGSGRGAKYIALEKAGNNGCTVGSDVPHWTSGGHFTYEYAGCKPDYPVVIATFNGKHGKAEVNKDPGATSSWVPKEIWGFFTRF